jgi:hypothetical protein
VPPELTTHDTPGSLVVFAAKRPPQIEAWQSSSPSGRRAVGVYKLKAAKLAIHVEFVCNFQSFPTSSWRSDGPCSTRQLLRLFCKLAVEFWQDPNEPIQIPQHYFWEGFSLIFAKWHYAPMHVCCLRLGLNCLLSPQMSNQSASAECNFVLKNRVTQFRACKYKLACLLVGNDEETIAEQWRPPDETYNCVTHEASTAWEMLGN